VDLGPPEHDVRHLPSAQLAARLVALGEQPDDLTDRHAECADRHQEDAEAELVCGRAGWHESARALREQGGGRAAKGVGGRGGQHQVNQLRHTSHRVRHDVVPLCRLQRHRTLLDGICELGDAAAKDARPRMRFALVGGDQVQRPFFRADGEVPRAVAVLERRSR
jgi:hypothetical protein